MIEQARLLLPCVINSVHITKLVPTLPRGNAYFTKQGRYAFPRGSVGTSCGLFASCRLYTINIGQNVEQECSTYCDNSEDLGNNGKR